MNNHASRAAPIPAEGVVFVADGSGDLRQVTDNLALATRETHASTSVQRVHWSHGKGAVFPDLYDAENHQNQGKQLARQIMAQRDGNPRCRICLVGYSSGAAVALAATPYLPEGSLDRIVLLSPCVSSRHDLRPALRCSREGIDEFHSEWDVICLTLFVTGTGEGAGQTVAGRSGFVPVGDTPEDRQLYSKLRPHPWNGAERQAGHDGSHFGCVNRDFLRTQVLPFLCPAY
jgi:hypothetical protein